MSSERGALGQLAACTALASVLSACSSGSGGSDVDAHSATPPTARVEVLNGGTSRTFREGSEVLLTGKASEDGDGPLIAWSFAQTAGPKVRLLEVNNTTVRFTAPAVDSPTTVAVQLTVEDSTRNFGSTTAEIEVVHVHGVRELAGACHRFGQQRAIRRGESGLAEPRVE